MGFKFNDRICIIEVEDKKYPVVFQKPLVDRLGSIKDTFLSLKNDSGTDEEKVILAFDNAIDSILGDGSASKIFADRLPNIVERYAVLKYIYDEITAFMQRIAGEKNVVLPEAKDHKHRQYPRSR